MDKTVQVFQSFAEADAADRAYYLSLTPKERVDILLELVRRSQGDPPPRLERVYRIIKLAPR